MESIFVQIASYRDYECQWTIRDLFKKARHPGRITVGVCAQWDPEEDQDCFEVMTRPEQVRTMRFHWKESQGVCWARHQAQKLWRGEDYTLVIDSHTRFVEDWDERVLKQLAECPSPRAVLTNHPASYIPPDNLDLDALPTVLRAHLFDDDGDLRFRGFFLDRFPEKPLRGAFVAAAFMFGAGTLITDVPFDPYIYFNQEELSFSVRLFTHGVDVYSPRDILAYHYYHGAPQTRMRRLHWDDNPDWRKLQERAKKRLFHLLQHTPSEDPEVICELDKYGLGQERSLTEYEAFCGIDFRRRQVSERALRCGFIDELSRYKSTPIEIPEIDAARRTAETTMLAPAIIAAEARPFGSVSSVGRRQRELKVAPGMPDGVLAIHDYVDISVCEKLRQYADAQAFSKLTVSVPKGAKGELAESPHSDRITHHVDIEGIACDVLSIFNDAFFNRLGPFYNVRFHWYERPQILRYPPGGKYNQHADADHWLPDESRWIRVQDRDYSVLLYLNDDYEGGELLLANQNWQFKPRPGTLLAFPSDHRFLHAALPTTSGIRYAIVSWGAIVGSPRVRPQPPHASVFFRS